MKIVLVRHGECEENFLRKILGRNNYLMNDSGRRQCQRLRMNLDKFSFDVCYMSPLVRCVESAMILVGDKVEMISDKRLINRDMGQLTGKSWQEYNAYQFWDYDLNWSKLDIEPIQDMFKRCEDFYHYLCEKCSDKIILIVTHEEIYRTLRYIIRNKKLKGKMFDGRIDNCFYESFDI